MDQNQLQYPKIAMLRLDRRSYAELWLDKHLRELDGLN